MGHCKIPAVLLQTASCIIQRSDGIVADINLGPLLRRATVATFFRFFASRKAQILQANTLQSRSAGKQPSALERLHRHPHTSTPWLVDSILCCTVPSTYAGFAVLLNGAKVYRQPRIRSSHYGQLQRMTWRNGDRPGAERDAHSQLVIHKACKGRM